MSYSNLSDSFEYLCHGSTAIIYSFKNYSAHPLQTVNCYRNSRLVVDEDDLKWEANEKKILQLLDNPIKKSL